MSTAVSFSLCLFIFLSFCLPVFWVTVFLSLSLFFRLSVSFSPCLSIFLFFCLFFSLSLFLSVSLFFCLSVYWKKGKIYVSLLSAKFLLMSTKFYVIGKIKINVYLHYKLLLLDYCLNYWFEYLLSGRKGKNQSQQVLWC